MASSSVEAGRIGTEEAAVALLRHGPMVAWNLRRTLRRHGYTSFLRTDRSFADLMDGLVADGRVAGWRPGGGPYLWYRLTAAGADAAGSST